ncbi:MAG TPA: DUF58 domain-containing protein [Thermoplasmata archaeon]|nr:DUF58 domain-containing protein [Thermoplasmata archaeon]
MSAPAPGGLHWRPRTYLLLAVGAALAAAGVVLRDPTPLYLALVLLLAPVAAAFAAPRRDPVVRLAWGENGPLDEIRVEGAVTPPEGIAPEDLEVSVARPPGLGGPSAAATRVEGGAVRFEGRWSTDAPAITPVAPPHVVWRDPAGLVERAVALDAADLTVVRYPPELTRLRLVRLDRTTVLPGEIRSRRIGASGEFFGVREAVAGDPARRVNWWASARRGRLLANEYALERAGDVVVFVDLRPTSLGREADERLLGIERATALGVADSFVAAKARVGIALFGEFLDAVPLSTGRDQRLRIRAALASARRAHVGGPSERGGVALRRFFPPGTTTILVSPLVDEAADPLVPHLTRRGYPVVVLSPSPVALLPRGAALAPEDEALADRLARLLRRAELAGTWQFAPVVDWTDAGSLGGFVEFLRRPSPRRSS